MPEDAETKLAEVAGTALMTGKPARIVSSAARRALSRYEGVDDSAPWKRWTAYLLVLLIERERENEALRAALKPFAEVARDFHIEPDELRAFVGARTPVVGDFRTAARLLEPRADTPAEEKP